MTKQPNIPLRIIHTSGGGLQRNLVFIASETDRGQLILKLNLPIEYVLMYLKKQRKGKITHKSIFCKAYFERLSSLPENFI